MSVTGRPGCGGDRPRSSHTLMFIGWLARERETDRERERERERETLRERENLLL
jgi:nicotinamide mononucleotide (NMN) deamidase PncC